MTNKESRLASLAEQRDRKLCVKKGVTDLRRPLKERTKGLKLYVVENRKPIYGPNEGDDMATGTGNRNGLSNFGMSRRGAM